MTTKLLTIFARAPLHVGCGSSVGAVDQPVLRERHTGFPAIPGSAIKGVLADLWNKKASDNKITRSEDGVRLFGNDKSQQASAGKLLIGEGKLLAFPVRSAKGAFAWLTCPLALNRFKRDAGAAFPVPEVADGKALVTQDAVLGIDGKAIFEEYPLEVASATIDAQIVSNLQKLCADNVWQELPQRLAIVSDELFQYFCLNACEIAQHNRIDDETGVVADGALFSQENVPSETLFYSVVNAADSENMDALAEGLANAGGLLQIGADATTGLGWCSVALKEVE